jgi:CRISPR system Cascade subunit CasA
MTCRYSLLDEPLIRARLVNGGAPQSFTLPALFVALQQDQIRDFPALRPHQRHPWHAFLVQLAAIALSRAETTELFTDETTWREALLALTADDLDGAAWCLIAPTDRPAFMQPPVPGEAVVKWKNHLLAPDELDMLVTSKNHDLKAARMVKSLPDDWVMALLSLQTQEGFLGAGNYGISRMNGGFASRPALGVTPKGHWGRRWQRDVAALIHHRRELIERYGFQEDGVALVWTRPWDGSNSLSFDALDPFYIEICRRVRLTQQGEQLVACATGSKVARIEAKQLNGLTGDPWTPINVNEAKAFTLGGKGFDYKLASELVFGTGTYRQPIAQALRDDDGTEGIVILAQGVTRGQGKTEGYHERRIPLSPKVRRMLLQHQTDQLAAVAAERVKDIGEMRVVLKSALVTLFDNGVKKPKSGHEKETSSEKKAKRYLRQFEAQEDHRFFTSLNAEIEADDPSQARLNWLVAMAERADAVLKRAFEAGPRSGEQRYRARAAALSRFHGTLRGEKSPLPDLRDHYREQKLQKEIADET